MKIARSFLTRVAIGVSCAICAYAWLIENIAQFRYYFFNSIGNESWQWGAASPGSVSIPMFAGVISFIVFSLLFLLNAEQLKRKRFHRIHYTVILIVAVAVVTASAIILNVCHSPFQIIALPIAAAFSGLSLWATTVVRAANRFAGKLNRDNFFTQYPVKTPQGAPVAVLLVANTLMLAGTMAAGSPVFAVFPLISFAAVAFVCGVIENLSGQYRKANESQLKSERFKAELITNVSHDIRTPLTSIINYVDLMRRLQIQDEKLNEYLTVLETKGARLKLLINDLLDASKASTGNVQMNIAPIDLLELLGQVAGEFDGAFAEKGLTYVSRHGSASVWAAADGKHLWRVLENLFGNALKYAMPNTRVYAETTIRDDINLSLKNVSAAPLDVPADMLTEQFIQGERSRVTDGNGLGLYIAKSLLELMHGKLEIVISGDLFEVAVKLPKSEWR